MQDRPDLPEDVSPPPAADDTASSPDADVAEPPEADGIVVVGHPADREHRRGWQWIVAAVVGVAVVVLLGYLAVALAATRSDVDALGDELAQMKGDVADAGTRLGDVESQLSDLDVWLTAVLGSSFSDAIPANGDLPPFEDSTNDLAVLAGMTLPTIEGPEYGSGTAVTYHPDDGIARVWLVWAHWCPHCQAELPELATWYRDNAALYPGLELVTVSTAIDESRDNPLLPYLEESAFPFPVIIDEDGTQGSHFGATVFPFWVITDPDGTVLVRLGGELDISQVDAIFAQLADIAANS
jgi:cytochrome c biogenesis protein CcmG/thiol:disulfide interchange protein DsbE